MEIIESVNGNCNGIVAIYCEGELTDTVEFTYRDNAEQYFDTYPLDEFADKVVLFGYDPWGEWDELDTRELDPD